MSKEFKSFQRQCVTAASEATYRYWKKVISGIVFLLLSGVPHKLLINSAVISRSKTLSVMS